MEHPVKSQKHNAAKVEYEFLSVCKYASAFTFRKALSDFRVTKACL